MKPIKPTKPKFDESSNVLLVGFDNAHGDDAAVLIVGKKRKNQSVEIINAFQGQEAVELYNKLSANMFKEGKDG